MHAISARKSAKTPRTGATFPISTLWNPVSMLAFKRVTISNANYSKQYANAILTQMQAHIYGQTAPTTKPAGDGPQHAPQSFQAQIPCFIIPTWTSSSSSPPKESLLSNLTMLSYPTAAAQCLLRVKKDANAKNTRLASHTEIAQNLSPRFRCYLHAQQLHLTSIICRNSNRLATMPLHPQPGDNGQYQCCYKFPFPHIKAKV